MILTVVGLLLTLYAVSPSSFPAGLEAGLDGFRWVISLLFVLQSSFWCPEPSRPEADRGMVFGHWAARVRKQLISHAPHRASSYIVWGVPSRRRPWRRLRARRAATQLCPRGFVGNRASG